MVVSRAIRVTGCASCRLSLLRAFTSIAGPRLLPISSKLPHSVPSSRAQYSSQVVRGEAQDHGIEAREFNAGEEISEQAVEDKVDEPEELEVKSTEVSALPWYLQVDTPTRAPQPLSERQKIPDLPESPPPILEPLLKQISIDLGLDDLSLLDLRKLDPPPALGANLLMLIGTARSEKHLHVSADRLCRWLRSTYKLRPDADGLLGRNELKLKLRRKSRRAKLIGSKADETADDGVRTGWVCVDVGVVESPDTEEAPAPRGFVGFGRRTDGVRIVVQMLTEEKRAEIDLERLWSGILKRGGQPAIEDFEDESFEPDLLPEPAKQIESRFSPILSQTRGFHTSTRQNLPSMQTRSAPVAPHFDYLPLSMRAMEDIQQLYNLTNSLFRSDKSRTKDVLRAYGVPEQHDQNWRAFVLYHLKNYAEKLPKTETLENLGKGFADNSSTIFLGYFHSIMSEIPSEAEAEAKIWLQSYAKRLGHPGYTTEGLLKTFREIQVSGIRVCRESYRDLLQQVLRPDNDIEPETYLAPSQATVDDTMDILQAMHNQGHDILKEDILVDLQESAAPLALPTLDSTQMFKNQYTFELASVEMNPIQHRLHVLMNSVTLPSFSDESKLRLMKLYAGQHHWHAFWDVWKMAPLREQPQSATMYNYMFNTVAGTQNQSSCKEVLQTWLPDMDREVPAVLLRGSKPKAGDVGDAVMACLKVIQPTIEEDSLIPGAEGEWVDIWKRCTEQ